MADVAAAAPDTAPLLEAKGVSKTYGHVDALVDVSLTIRPRQTVALVGDNGAGKSTLVKCLAGAVMPDSGDIRVGGAKVAFSSPKDARDVGISTVYQDLALANNLTVAENICLSDVPVTRFGRVDRRRMGREARDILRDLAINIPGPSARVSSLSGGQRQAVAIARGVRDGGRLMILDEPTAALGVQEGAKVLTLIAEVSRTRDMAFLIISHNLDHVFALSDQIVVLRGGRKAGTCVTGKTSREQVVSLIVGGSAPLATP